MLEAAVAPEAQRFLHETVAPALAPLAEDDYQFGPAVLLTTEARFVYVVDGAQVWWLVEWPPGIVAMRFGPEGAYEVARLPIEDDDHPVVELVTVPWSAQFDEADRADAGFARSSLETQEAWEQAMAPVQALGERLSAFLADEEAIEAWRNRAANSPWVRESFSP